MSAISDLSVTSVPKTDPASSQSSAQLRTLAAQFESLLLAQMMREMRSSMFDDGEDESSGFGDGPLSDTVFAELSQALSRAGGMGLGASLLGPLTEQAGLGGSQAFAAALASRGSVAPSMPSLTGLDAPRLNADDSHIPVSLLGRVSSTYGWRRDPIDGASTFHKGLDLAMPVGQEVPAARAGAVEFAGELPGYGLTVLVNHGSGVSTRYAHLSEVIVSKGDTVEAGQTVARSGSTGRSTGPHLHFEILANGVAVDPAAGWPR